MSRVRPGLSSCSGNVTGAAIDILYMLPSCVPATPLDIGGATLDADTLLRFIGRDGIIGLGEMMNVPGVLAGERGYRGKNWHSLRIRDGHAPMLNGKRSERLHPCRASRAITNRRASARHRRNCGAGCTFLSGRGRPSRVSKTRTRRHGKDRVPVLFCNR